MTGKAMDYCHRDLGKHFLLNDKYSQVLEIGAGTSPHISYIKHIYNKYYSLETSKFAVEYLKKNSSHLLQWNQNAWFKLIL